MTSRYTKGQSGNPSGRPRGSGKVARLREAIGRDLPDIIAKLVEQAKAGDVQAARVLLDRVLPSLKAESLPVHLPGLLAASTLTERAEAALEAAASGELPADVAAALVTAVGALARVVEIDEIERRIAALEQKS